MFTFRSKCICLNKEIMNGQWTVSNHYLSGCSNIYIFSLSIRCLLRFICPNHYLMNIHIHLFLLSSQLTEKQAKPVAVGLLCPPLFFLSSHIIGFLSVLLNSACDPIKQNQGLVHVKNNQFIV